MLIEGLKNLLAAVGASMMLAALAQGQAAAPAQPQWVDRGEYDLVQEIGKTTDDAKRLELLNQWKQKYPATAFIDTRHQFYLTTYQNLKRAEPMAAEAQEMVNANPKSLIGLYFLQTLTFSMVGPEAQDRGEKAANGMLTNLDAIFAPDKKPNPTLTDEQWKKQRTDMEALAHKTLGYVALQRKQNEQAETEFTKVLQITPNDSQVSYWMASAIVAQRKQERYPAAAFQLARAAAYDGEGAMPQAARPEARKSLERIYKNYHGDLSGLDELLALAKTNPLPPADWKLKSVVEIQQEKLKKDKEFADANPELAAWVSMKNELTGPNSDAYFNEMKGKALPTLKGKLVSQSPERNPKQLVLGLTGDTAEVTLKMEEGRLAGKMDPGAELSFKEAVPESFTKDPFNVTMTVDKANISGWKSTAPPPVKKAVGAKKGAAKKK